MPRNRRFSWCRFGIAALAAGWAGLAWGASAWAVHWQNDLAWRVQSMGGALLAVEDESTQLNLFNSENPAGLAFLPREDRLDLGADYHVEFGEGQTRNEIELIRPGAEYYGLTHWFSDAAVVRLLGGGDLSYFSAGGTGRWGSDAFAGADLAVVVLPNLVAAGRVRWNQPVQPADPNSGYNPFVLWQGALSYRAGAAPVVGEVQVGLMAGNDDDPGDFGGYQTSGVQDEDVLETANGPLLRVDSTSSSDAFHNSFSVNSRRVSGQVIVLPKDWLALSGVVDYQHRVTTSEILEQFSSVETVTGTGNPLTDFTAVTTGSTVTDETLTEDRMGLTGTLRVKVPIDESTQILAGARYSTWGSASDQITSTVVSRVPRTTVTTTGGGTITQTLGGGPGAGGTSSSADVKVSRVEAGLGVQGWLRRVQAAVQYARVDESITGQPAVRAETYRGGAEFWWLPIVAFRGGLAWTTPDQGEWDLGMGLDLPTGIKVDLLWACRYTLAALSTAALLPHLDSSGLYLAARQVF